MLSRNDLVYESTKKVSTEQFDELAHEAHSNKISVPVDYDTIWLHQKDDTELKKFRIDQKTKQKYKTTDFGRMILWKKKGEGGQHRIRLLVTLRLDLLEWYHDTLQHPE